MKTFKAYLEKLIKGEQKVSVKSKENSVKLTFRPMEDTHSDYQQRTPKHYSRRVVVKKADLQKALEEVQALFIERDDAVKFSIEDNALKISTPHSDNGGVIKKLDVKYDGDLFTTIFTLKHILDAVETISADNLVIDFEETYNSKAFKDNEDIGHSNDSSASSSSDDSSSSD